LREVAIWCIAGWSIVALGVRPFRFPEWIWPVAGAGLLVLCGIVAPREALSAASDGVDVYAFLAGVLLVAELARVFGVFEVLATQLVRACRGSAYRLFTGAFAGGAVVTAFLANDGTIVLLTPIAIALVARARLPARPFVYAIAFVANAASFILPFSNPANLVVFSRLPRLSEWIAHFTLASVAAVACTYAVLRIVFACELGEAVAVPEAGRFPRSGRLAAICTAGSTGALIVGTAIGWNVGFTALGAACVSLVLLTAADRRAAFSAVREAPFSIVPLTAGLFVLVAAVDRTGMLGAARGLYHAAQGLGNVPGALAVGAAAMGADALLNNLPAAVIARFSLHGAAPPGYVVRAALVGIDLGPNLSLPASLATVLWLMLLRKAGLEVGFREFLRLGALVTIPSLAVALLAVAL
jgi:arsenical pump membrane protein